ncbi:MAG: cytochrome c family protein [Gemmatimonadota bacterium]|nr:cytochrome c family protein [Gemmatimonadota bacterium]MDH5758013.1 cytochrome c family protein [Gemmatimonadota bacterium]
MKKHWLMGGFVGVIALAAAAFVQEQDAPVAGGDSPAAYPSGQPIAFPHNQHAGSEPGQNNMDCMFCHFSAERSVDAGIPPVSTCMGCHAVIPGTQNPQEIDKLRNYATTQEPIPWVRVYKVSDHVHFPHMRHVNAGLQCQQCHGQVQEMTVLNSRAPEWGGDNMGWCVDCHRQSEASTDCSVCHY